MSKQTEITMNGEGKTQTRRSAQARRGVNFLFTFIVISIFLFSFSLVSAYDSHKQNTNLTLVHQSGNASGCNLTYIQYPDGTLKTSNNAFTKTGNTFFITIASNNYTQLGSLCHGLVCFEGQTNQTATLCREITPSGFTNTNTFFFLFIIIIALIFILGFKLENPWIMMLGSTLIVILGFFIMKNGLGILKDTQTTWAIALTVWGIGIYCWFLCMEEFLKWFNSK